MTPPDQIAQIVAGLTEAQRRACIWFGCAADHGVVSTIGLRGITYDQP